MGTITRQTSVPAPQASFLEAPRALFKAFQKQLGFDVQIHSIKPEGFDRWTVTYNNSQTQTFSYKDLEGELFVSTRRHLQPPILVGDGKGYSSAASLYFKYNKVSETELTKKPSLFEAPPRLVGDKGLLYLTKGLSRIERVFYKIFKPTAYAAWQEQNRVTIQGYKDYLIHECGEAKFQQIQKVYGIDLDEVELLEPKLIYFFNIGMNNIELEDVDAFRQRLQKGESLTGREQRAGLQTENFKTLDRLVEEMDHDEFQTLVEALVTPENEWEGIYTGRKIEAEIMGCYNYSTKDRETRRPWIDQQELLQVFPTIKEQNGNREKLDHFFYEMLVKVVVKKHLMRSDNDGNWTVGALIPSPYRDSQGKTIYYRVDQGVDSGKGKLWYVFKPANDNADSSLPIIRATHDTSYEGFNQRGFPTITRDLSQTPGYLYSDTTQEEDQAFFKEFTLPAPMVYLARLAKEKSHDAYACAHEVLIKALIAERFHNGVDYLNKMRNCSPDEYINAARSVFHPEWKDDWKRFDALIEGKAPRPFASVGNSLGGFDAQHDLAQYTALSGRLPISNMDLYTHSSLKVDDAEEETFSTFFDFHKVRVLDPLEIDVSIKHVTEKDDPVTLYPVGTLLGKRIKHIKTQLSVFTVKDKEHPQFVPNIHLRRIENLTHGTHYDLEETTIKAYDQYGLKKLGDIFDFVSKSASRNAKLNRLAEAALKTEDPERTGSLRGIPEGKEESKLVATRTGYHFSTNP